MTAFHEVASALTALEKRAQVEAEQARAVTASTDAVQSATRRYRGGLASYCLRLGGAKPLPLGGSFSRFCVDWGT